MSTPTAFPKLSAQTCGSVLVHRDTPRYCPHMSNAHTTTADPIIHVRTGKGVRTARLSEVVARLWPRFSDDGDMLDRKIRTANRLPDAVADVRDDVLAALLDASPQ